MIFKCVTIFSHAFHYRAFNFYSDKVKNKGEAYCEQPEARALQLIFLTTSPESLRNMVFLKPLSNYASGHHALCNEPIATYTVGERLRQLRVARQRFHLCLDPVVQRLHPRHRLHFSDRQPLLRRAATYF